MYKGTKIEVVPLDLYNSSEISGLYINKVIGMYKLHEEFNFFTKISKNYILSKVIIHYLNRSCWNRIRLITSSE